MAHYRIEVIVESDRDEGEMALYAEGVAHGHFRNVEDIVVYEITRAHGKH